MTKNQIIVLAFFLAYSVRNSASVASRIALEKYIIIIIIIIIILIPSVVKIPRVKN